MGTPPPEHLGRRHRARTVELALRLLRVLLTVTCFYTSTAEAKTYDWYLQLNSVTVDERSVRQSIALEVSEIEIPDDPYRGDEDGSISLHIEVTSVEGKLIVALWDRGDLAGRRSVSDSGPTRLVARRIGLAVAELARDLRDRRLRTERILAQERHFIERRALMSAYRAQQRALGLRAGLRAEVVPEGGVLFGPSLGVEFNDKFPLRFVVGLSWGIGWLNGLRSGDGSAHAPPWSKWQLEWGADWVMQPEIRTQLSLGVHAGASIVHVGSGAEVDHVSGQSDTYGAQLGMRLAWASHHDLAVWPRIELEAGRILRPVPIQFETENIELGGWYVSLGLSAVMFQ